MLTQYVLPLLAIGLRGTLALPNPLVGLSTSTGPASLPTEIPETNCLLYIKCSANYHAIRDASTNSCSCELNTPEIDPATCPNIRCAEGTIATYLPEKKHCICETYPPPPETCPNVRCGEGTSAVYYPGKGHCACEPSSKVTLASKLARDVEIEERDSSDDAKCPGIYCAGDAHKKFHSLTKTCTCELNNAVPSTCPQMKCASGHHRVYHPETKNCTCDIDCPDLMCLVNLNPTYNGTTNVCTCEPSVGTVNPPILPPGTPRPLCPDTICLAEMEPIYNFTSGYCYCEFLPGFSKRSGEHASTVELKEEVEERDVLPPVANKCVDTLCVGERQAVWNTTTKACECSYIPGMEPGPQVLCPDAMCTAEKEPIFNFTSGLCYCEWLPEFFTKKSALPVTLEERAEGEEAIPCHGMACISEMRPVWNATSQTCKCEWIPGMEFSPLPTISTASKTTPTLPRPTKKQPCGMMACMGRIDLNTCTCDTSQGAAVKREEENHEPTTTKTYIYPVPTSKPQPTTTITYINPHTPEPTTTQTYINPIPTTAKPSTPLESCTDMPIYHPCSMVKCPYDTTPIETTGSCYCKPIKTLPPVTLPTVVPTKTYILPRTTDSEGSIPACYNVTCPLAFQTPTWLPQTTPHCSCVPIPGHTPSTSTSTPIGTLTSKPTWTYGTQTPTLIPWPITTKDIQTICPLGCPPPFSPTLDSNGRCACPSSMVSTPTTFKTLPWYPRYPPTGGTTTTPTPTPTSKATSTWKWPSITPVPTGKGCAGWMCISEQRPVWDEVTGRCVCVWIEGFGPVTI